MAAIQILRSLRRLRGEVTLLPRIVITPRRSESGGQRAEAGKTLVSFPQRPPHDWLSATGDNSAPQLPQPLDEGAGSSVHPGQQRSDPHQEEDSSSSSSSSSSSDSDSDQEEEEVPSAHTGRAEIQRQEVPSAHTGRAEIQRQEVPSVHTGRAEIQRQEVLREEEVPSARTGRAEIQRQEVLREEEVPSARTGRAESQRQEVPSAHTGRAKTRRQEVLREEAVPSEQKHSVHTGRAEAEEVPKDLADYPQIQNIPQSGQRKPGVGQVVSAEDLVDVAPAVGNISRSGQRTPGVGQDVSAEDLVDVAPAVGTEKAVENTRETSGQDEDVGEVPASDGSRDLSGETPDSSELTPPPPAPEEPFDNSKYQNQQHFSYTPFTFVDCDVDLAKYRLPQPSSGRPSPRH